MRKAVVIPGLMLALLVGRAWGTTASDGTVITNVASASYASSGLASFDVSYSATVWVMVRNPSVAIWKSGAPTVQAAGGEVTFTLCILNTSAYMTAFNVNLVDLMPVNMEWVAEGGKWPAGWGAVTYSGSWGGAYVAPVPAGQLSPLFIRWWRDTLAIGASGCVTYRARVL